uniref:tRNA-intron lyase n=1 Tax=Heliothis virescens TaxID=7102 RepID=A0A2A4J9G7_HELVI
MTTLQSEDCQTNDLNDSFPMAIESLRFPLDNSMRIVFTGYYNGFNVEVRSVEEIALLYHMGCFGKGSASRSQPKAAQNDVTPRIMRKRQFLKRNYWFKKFGGFKGTAEADNFMKDVEGLTAKIIGDSEKKTQKDVIDLVSSDEDDGGETNSTHSSERFQNHDKEDIVVIVPNILYKEGPGISHADNIVVIKSSYKEDDWISILGHVRMANTTVKEILIAEVIRPSENVKLPEDLKLFSVRELLLSRNLPVIINEDD